jgi:hypothetical protein
MGLIDAVKKKIDAVDKSFNPFRRVGDAMEQALKPKNEADAGEKARQEAIQRGKVITVDDSIKKRSF